MTEVPFLGPAALTATSKLTGNASESRPELRIGLDPAPKPAWQAVHRAHATTIRNQAGQDPII